ncbi:hypothetical protein [Saccharopolyspora shandongensis]|uniref:hypothetical protein n=1 Tax=Saccharopolyspora shandongensis TaxID=418495 RepID=UPI0033E76348
MLKGTIQVVCCNHNVVLCALSDSGATIQRTIWIGVRFGSGRKLVNITPLGQVVKVRRDHGEHPPNLLISFL